MLEKDKPNNLLWGKFSQSQKELDILYFKICQLGIQEQIDVLQYAFSIDDEANVWRYLLKVEPVDYRKSQRSLTKGLFTIILEAAIFPSNYELDAQALIIALAKDFLNYRDAIYSNALQYLDEADNTSDYEIYQRVYDLLVEIKSEYLEEFLKRCREHKSQDIRDIDT